MLKEAKAIGSFSVDNIEEAKAFYGDTLGIEWSESMGVITLHTADNGKIFVYPKASHLPASFTVLNFMVTDVEKAVDDLVAKGVTFEQYADSIKTDTKGIVRGRGPLIAWFKDPAGNILSVIQER